MPYARNLELLKTPSKAKIAAAIRKVVRRMITKVLMPKLCEAMETGKVIKWLKKEGDAIKGGDVIAEIETDKANVEIEAFGAGVLRKILVGPGGQVPVGELIGVIADPADDIAARRRGAPAGRAPAPALRPGGPRPSRASRPAPCPMESYRSTPAHDRRGADGAGAVRRPPAGRRRAREGLAAGAQDRRPVRRGPALVQGTGPGGRIVRRDVEAASARRPAARRGAAAPAGPGGHASRFPRTAPSSRTGRSARCARSSPSGCRCRRRRCRTSTSVGGRDGPRLGAARRAERARGAAEDLGHRLVVKACARAAR